MPPTIEIAPSILAGQHANLAESLRHAEETVGVKWLHIDIMDGHFVPNLTFGPQTVKELRTRSSLYFDVHLMLDNPQNHIQAFLEAGADNITIHAEPTYPVEATLRTIRQSGSHCGIAINPGTPVDLLVPFLPAVDLVLLMTVQPGFGGQAFRDDVLPKIQWVHDWRTANQANFRIEVDGGVNLTTGQQCRRAGADTLVAGSAFYKAANSAMFVQELSNA